MPPSPHQPPDTCTEAPSVGTVGLAVLLTSSTFSVMAGAILGPAVNLIRDNLSLTVTETGLVLTAHALFMALSSPLWGWVIDRLGPKRPYLWGLLLFALSGVAGFWANDYWTLMASRALLGVAVGAFFNAITVIILGIGDPQWRIKVMGWRGSANSAGGSLWPMLGGGLGTLFWRLPFTVYLIGLPLALAAWRVLPSQVGRVPQCQTGSGPGLAQVIRERPLLLAVYMMGALWSILIYLIILFLPQVLALKGITNPFTISLFLSTFMLASGITSMFIPKICRRMSKDKIAMGVLCVWIGLLVGLSFLPSPPWLALCSALFGLGMGSLLPTLMVWVGELAPPHITGRTSSLLGSATFMGMFFSPLIFGPLVPWVGLPGVFIAGALICVLVWCLLLLLLRQAKSAE